MAASCDHAEFRAQVDVQRLLDSAVWYADVSIHCAGCGQKMEWIGFPMGLSPAEPMVDVTGTEARLPFRPYDEEQARARWLDHPAGFTIKRVC